MARSRWPFRDGVPLVTAFRILIVLIGVVAETWNIVDMVRSGERPSEHFAYFTIQSNALVMIVFAWMAIVPAWRRPAWFDELRGATTAFIVLTGLVYAALLAAPGEITSFDVHFSNFAQHRLIPILVLIDWLLVPTTRPIRVVRALSWMAYPLAYLASAWLRGLVDGWFPYPFLDPGVHGGWAGLVWPTGQVLIAFIVVTMLIAAIGRVRFRESVTPPGRRGARR